jgi:putative ABC transport system permease protein
MTQIVSQSVAGRRLQTALLGTFAAVAVLLAAIGVYGVVAYSVLQRRREIAVRLALGADQRDVRALILRHGMVPVFVGLVFGIIAAIFATRLIGSLLFEVRALDPITFLTAPLLLALAGGLPCYRAAQQAARTDPAIALQSE